jgi:predicted nucleic-acid-binding Zn-ribbon protein
MGDIIKFHKDDFELHYPHVVCKDCDGNEFHIKTTDDDKFYSIICIRCGNEIFCNLQPVFGPG